MNNNLSIYNHIFVNKFFDKYWLSEKTILLFFETLDRWFINHIRNNISDITFKNLFFREFYFLIKTNKINLFIQSYCFLLQNKKQIIFLLNNYHNELNFRNYLDNKIIFRYEIYNILKENVKFIRKLNLSFEEWISTVYSLNLLSINWWNYIKNIFFKIQFFDNSIDVTDLVNGITLSIFDWNIKLLGLTIYIWSTEILISNIQIFSNCTDFFIIKPRKILLYILIEITKRLWIKKLVSFSNQNHPCKNHTENNWFNWDYNNILKSIWMFYDNDWYFYWNIQEIQIKWLNNLIKENVDFNFNNIYSILKI